MGTGAIAAIVYGLYAAGLLFGVTPVIGVVIAHVKIGDARGTPYEWHFRHQIVTFWAALVLSLVGYALVPVFGLGFLVLVGTGVWYVWRIARGAIRLADEKPSGPDYSFKN